MRRRPDSIERKRPAQALPKAKVCRRTLSKPLRVEADEHAGLCFWALLLGAACFSQWLAALLRACGREAFHVDGGWRPAGPGGRCANAHVPQERVSMYATHTCVRMYMYMHVRVWVWVRAGMQVGGLAVAGG